MKLVNVDELVAEYRAELGINSPENRERLRRTVVDRALQILYAFQSGEPTGQPHKVRLLEMLASSFAVGAFLDDRRIDDILGSIDLDELFVGTGDTNPLDVYIEKE